MALELARFRIIMRTREELRLPPFPGTALRGAFGAAFRRVACSRRRETCDGCLLRGTCVYSYVFETPLPSDSEVLRRQEKIPHPFVFDIGSWGERRALGAGSDVGFGLVLVGRAIEYLPYFVLVFVEMAAAGLGKTRAKLELVSVAAVDMDGATKELYDPAADRIDPRFARTTWTPATADAPDACRVEFLTPLRLTDGGDLVGSRVEFAALARALLRRASSLSYFHCGERLRLDYAGLAERAARVRLEDARFEWRRLERYSSRQDARVSLGGLVGSARYAGDIGEFLPLLRLGEIIHVGKSTAFGLGQYRLEVCHGAS
jgi:hypothetical protein